MKDGSVNKDQQMKRLKPKHKDAASKTQRGKKKIQRKRGLKKMNRKNKNEKKTDK